MVKEGGKAREKDEERKVEKGEMRRMMRSLKERKTTGVMKYQMKHGNIEWE